jgi:hypothetical protein
MVRFSLHRPSKSSAVSTRCHAMTWRDLRGRVHLTVRPVPAGNAHGPRVALTTLRSDIRSAVTGPRHVSPCWLFRACRVLACSSRVRSSPQRDVSMPRLSPAFCATLLSGLATVPRADRVTTLRFSTRITRSRGRGFWWLSQPSPFGRSASLASGRRSGVFAFLPAVGPPSSTSEPALKPQEPLGFLGCRPWRLVISPGTVPPRQLRRPPRRRRRQCRMRAQGRGSQ